MAADDDCMHCEINAIVFTRLDAGMDVRDAVRDVAQVLADVIAVADGEVQQKLFDNAGEFIKKMINEHNERNKVPVAKPEPKPDEDDEEKRVLH